MRPWLVYALRMIDYKIIGWRWDFHPPHPNQRKDTPHGT